MLEQAFLYELICRDGGGYRCPRCYKFHGYTDGFGVSHCHNCGTFFSVQSGESQVGTSLKQMFVRLRDWLKAIAAQIRGQH